MGEVSGIFFLKNVMSVSLLCKVGEVSGIFFLNTCKCEVSAIVVKMSGESELVFKTGYESGILVKRS